MNVLSLFSGVGGFDLGLERAGHTIIGQVENDPFCQRVLAARWPRVERLGGVETFTRELRGHDGPVDCLAGGFPCQDLSVAGKRAGLGGARSGLFHEFVRIAKALTPTWGLVENVPGLLSSQGGADFLAVLEGLRECWPVVGYRILDSQHFGVPQRRRRVFLVGGPTADGVAQVLALTESGGGDSPAGGQAGARASRGLESGIEQSGRIYDSDGVAPMMRHGTGGMTGPMVCFDPTTSLDQAPHDRLAPPLKVGTGLASMPWAPAVLTHALDCGHGVTGDGTGRGAQLVAFDPRQITSPTNRSAPRAGDPCHTLPSTGGFAEAPMLASSAMIRRLTPLECERLQGFPDGWTCLCTPLSAYAADPDAAALACRCPDSPRYRAMGNAVTVNVLEWLGRRFPR